MNTTYQNPRPFALLAGRNSEAFTEEIGKEIDVVPIKRTIEDFPNGEIAVEIEQNVKGFEIFVIQTFMPGHINDALIELLLLADAVKRAGAERLNAVLRIFPYQRQDRRETNKRNRHRRRPISARLVADMLSMKYNGVVAFDLHAEQIEGFFSGVKFENIIPFKMFSDYLLETGIIKKTYDDNEKKPVFVGPDISSGKKVSDYAQNFNLSYAIVDKARKNGKEVEVRNVIGDVEGRVCVIIDDITATAGTLIGAKDALLDRGATKVIAIVTHFEGRGIEAIKKLANAGFSKIVLTDSITLNEEIKNYPVFEVLPLAPLVTKVMVKIYHSESLQPVVY